MDEVAELELGGAEELVVGLGGEQLGDGAEVVLGGGGEGVEELLGTSGLVFREMAIEGQKSNARSASGLVCWRP
jgi:hypothetical protein